MLVIVKSSASTGPHTMTIATFPTRHQLCCEAFTTAMAPVNVSSGVVTVTYRCVGSTAYISMADTVDLSSGPVVKLFSGMYNSLIMTHTQGTTAPVEFKYVGWRE